MIDVWEIPIPPLLGLCLYICLSSLPPSLPLLSLPPSVSATVMLSLSLCVCRQEVTQCLTESRQRDKLISQQTHRRGREEGGGRREAVGGGGVARKTKQTKDRMPKTLLKHQAMGVLLNSKPPPSPFQPPSPPKTHIHTCRHTTRLNLQEVLGPLSSIHTHTHTQEIEDGEPDIWSILTLINWWPTITKKKVMKAINHFLLSGRLSPVNLAPGINLNSPPWQWQQKSNIDIHILGHYDSTVTVKAHGNHRHPRSICAELLRHIWEKKRNLIFSFLKTKFRCTETGGTLHTGCNASPINKNRSFCIHTCVHFLSWTLREIVCQEFLQQRTQLCLTNGMSIRCQPEGHIHFSPWGMHHLQS